MVHPLAEFTPEQFRELSEIKVGQGNPELIENPFWEAMIRSGLSAFEAREYFPKDSASAGPVWCFQRRRWSQTSMADGSAVIIGGSHEDFYDPDFAIYNDVVVCHMSGTVDIYGYPPDKFLPTDGHTATLVGDEIWIIGCIGYKHDRVLGTTPIHCLELDTMSIREVQPKGDEPGWIYAHEGIHWKKEDSILIWGGSIMTESGAVANQAMWAFSLADHLWRRVESVQL